MNINLRKANALQNSILESIREIDIQTHIDLNEFQIIEQEIKKANDLVFANDARRQKLLFAYYNIRGLVGAANASTDININLTKSAYIDKRISQLEVFNNLKSITPIEILKGKLEKIKNRADDRPLFSRDENVSTSVVTDEQISQVKSEIKNLKKQKQKLNDEILELNIKTEIPLSDDVLNTLKSEGLI